MPGDDLATVNYHFEDIATPDFDPTALTPWIKQVIAAHGAELVALQYIFCSDNYLHRINVDYLDHDTLTDIITFPYAPPPHIHGDLYISLERVVENAHDRGITYYDECCRVMIHGVLHLCGFGDKTVAEAARMRELENAALALR